MATKPVCKIKECGKPSRTAGLCGMHYQRKLRGTPMTVPAKTPARMGALLEWVEDHIDFSSDDCLAWPFGRDQKGYGAVKFRGIQTNAHRVMCILAHGEPTSEMQHALHSCGQGHNGCVNPRHLRWGSVKDNCDDRTKHAKQRLSG